MDRVAATTLQKAGDIEFIEISLYSADSDYQQQISKTPKDGIDISLYVGEISLFEDMFGPGMTGSLLMLDALNLFEKLDLRGNEWLNLKFRTPTMDDDALIWKRFKVYSITDRQMISDTGKQSYILHFCSPEILIDIVSPIQKTYRGRVDDVVRQIYARIAVPRAVGNNNLTELVINGPTANETTFVSPNWTPIQSINWLASRAQPANLKNPGYLFFESNKKYNFTNVEYIIDEAVRSGSFYQNYKYIARSAIPEIPTDGSRYIANVDDDFKKIENLTILEDYNYLKNSQNGYYANRLYTLDVITKRYKHRDYDHVNSYNQYAHLGYIKPTLNTPNTGGQDCKPFNDSDTYNVLGHQNFYPQHSDLFTGAKSNVGDIIDKVLPQRISTLNEITNIKMEITVPGRTDVEVGKVVHLWYPSASERGDDDKLGTLYDVRYTGFYLITAIRHKFTLLSHTMTLEIVKDSLGRAQV